MIRIIPSIASCNPLDIGLELSRLGNGVSLHIDIEDGNFLPNITFGEKTVRAMRERTALPFNAHFMVTNPYRYIDMLSPCGVTEAAAHIESLPYPMDYLNRLRRLQVSPGLALNMKTPVDTIAPFFSELDFVLLMTAEPDNNAQSFARSSLMRIRQLRSILPTEKKIWVDGGVGEAELPAVVSAGAEVIIMGRGVFHCQDPLAQIHRLEGTAPKLPPHQQEREEKRPHG